VPGHENIDGNKMTDYLTRLGFEQPSIGPELALSISMGVAKKVVRDWTIRDCMTRGFLKWAQTGKGTHIGTLCQKDKGAVKI
jgi:hypothetical protein